MTASRSLRVADDFLARLTPENRAIIRSLRETILLAAAGAVETLLWNGLSYHRPMIGGRVKGAVCQIHVKDGIVHLGFIHGKALPDPGQLLLGNRKSKRFLFILSREDANRAETVALIRAAAAYDPMSGTAS